MHSISYGMYRPVYTKRLRYGQSNTRDASQAKREVNKVNKMHRRTFLNRAMQGTLGLSILMNSRSVWSYQANEKLNIGLIGVSGRGGWFVKAIPRLGQNVVALCDVNEKRAAEAFKQFAQAKNFSDYRRMLQDMDKSLDAVVVATCDHTHAVISAAAMKQGKHVYCEKPLTHDIFEARTLRKLAAQHKVATQMGNQGTASVGFRRAVELVQSGVIGDVREVHAWNTGGGAGPRRLPTDTPEAPDYLNWDIWLGPAAERTYHHEWLKWHAWRDFATGQLGNWGSHTMNLPFKALRLDTLWEQDDRLGIQSDFTRTINVEAEVSSLCAATFPRWEIIHYEFPRRGAMSAVRIHWYNGGGKAPGPRKMIEEFMDRQLDWGDAGEKMWKDHAGCLLVGTRGMIHSTGHNTSYTLLPRNKFKDFKGPEPTLPRSRGHENEWLTACRGGPAAMSDFNYAGRLTEFVLLGNVATLYPQKLTYDPIAMKIVNHQPAHQTLHREYRKGWSL